MASGCRFSAGTAVPARLARSDRAVDADHGCRASRNRRPSIQAVRTVAGAPSFADRADGASVRWWPFSGPAGGRRAATPKIGGCPVFPAFKGSATARSAANQTAWNQDVSKAPVDPRSSALHRPDHRPGRQPGGPPRLRRQRRLRDPLHHRRPRPAPGPGQGHGLSGPERLRARADPRQRAGRERLRPPRARAPAPPAATCSRCTRPTTSAATVTAGPPARRPASTCARRSAPPRRLDVGRRRGAPDPRRAWSATARSSRGHVRHAIRVTFDETRRAYIHPATHYASDLLRPEPAPDGPPAAALSTLLPRQPRPLPGRAASRG